MLETFDIWEPNAENQNIIDAATEAAEDMAAFQPTLRTIYYQLVANKTIANVQTEYKRLGNILTKARNSGLFPWDAFQDKGRVPHLSWSQESAEDALDGIEYQIKFDQWARQENYCEVWVEKQAQEGVVSKVCNPLQVPWLSCKGYLSATASYDAGKRFAHARAMGKNTFLIHLGDHDPSGIDMTRDNRERVEKYGRLFEVETRRIALNMDQVEEFNLPPDPAKLSESRAQGYIDQYGSSSWELDALKPQLLRPIIREEIEQLIDTEKWDEVKAEQEEVRDKLRWISNNVDDVLDYAADRAADEE